MLNRIRAHVAVTSMRATLAAPRGAQSVLCTRRAPLAASHRDGMFALTHRAPSRSRGAVVLDPPAVSDQSPPQLRDQLQATLGATYTLERELGGGGMSRVFLAREAALERDVVVKVMSPDLAADVSAERFMREIKLAASLQQANIVPLLAAGETDGLPYYTMPFVDGLSLRARLGRSGALPVGEAISILRDVARALAYAHEHGVVHRDIKPDNILLSGDAAVVTDFGIAKALAASKTQALGGTLTQVGMGIGTPAYMAPEQAAGDPAADHRADLYALGCVAYEMLTGTAPFAGRPTHQLLAAHLNETPAGLESTRSDVPRALAALVMGCLAKNPAARPQNARAVLAALDGIGPGNTLGESATLQAGKRRRPALVAAAVLVAMLAAVAAAALSARMIRARGAATGPSSIAVLPFENQGDAADTYFADGITDAVRGKLTALAGSGLAVVARASSVSYRGTAKPPAVIASELGVRYLLTGTVRFAGTGAERRVQVSPELVEISAGHAPESRWAQPFDAAIKDVFAVQADIAGRVATAMQVALGSAAHARIAETPTRDIEAYDAYLRGNSLSTRPMWFVPQARRDAVRLYERAVALDPGFAPAWARLSLAHRQMYAREDDPTPARLDQARAAANRALALDPTLPEANVAYAELTDDPRAALERCAVALRSHPDNVELLYLLGSEQRRLGRYEEALTSYTRAATLDPRAPNGPAEIANLHDERRDYAAAVQARERELTLTPDNSVAYVAQALSYVNWRGDTSAAREMIATGVIAAGRARLIRTLASSAGVLASRVLWPALDVETRQALDTITVRAAEGTAWDVYRLKAEHAERSRQPARARAYDDSARRAVEAQVLLRPDDPKLRSSLGLAYAALGRPTDAVREGQQAVALAGMTRYDDDRAMINFTLAMIYVRIGERGAAIDQLAAGLPTSSPSVSVYWLRLDPIWDPLRGIVRFRHLLDAMPEATVHAPGRATVHDGK